MEGLQLLAEVTVQDHQQEEQEDRIFALLLHGLLYVPGMLDVFRTAVETLPQDHQHIIRQGLTKAIEEHKKQLTYSP